MSRSKPVLRLSLCICLVCLYGRMLAAEGPGYKYFVSGEPSAVAGKTKPGFALMGGGEDQDAAFHWMCELAGSGGNFVVLRASGTDAYNPYVRKLCPAMSAVETLIITSREGAAQPFVAETIRKASAVFLAGGSQDNYINFWSGTPVADSINEAIKNGVPVGGTSAGLAVLGDYSFAALKDTVKSKEALANPFDEHVTLTRDFLHVPMLGGIITDSHFVARDRMGRLLVFLARIAKDGWTDTPRAIAIDEKTAVLLESDGKARVTGAGTVYFIKAPGLPEKCIPDVPLTFRNLAVYRLSAGAGSFDVRSWSGIGGSGYKLSVEDGVVKSTLAGNKLY
ncbi:MAG TPA: cyanophycinase [Bryobacteraceae bacterium]|nr:cyanophycinase [Bryobacteraceae bacterium]